MRKVLHLGLARFKRAGEPLHKKTKKDERASSLVLSAQPVGFRISSSGDETV